MSEVPYSLTQIPENGQYPIGHEDLKQDIQSLLEKACDTNQGSVRVSREISLSDDERNTEHKLYKKYLFPEGSSNAAFRYELRHSNASEQDGVACEPYIVRRAFIPATSLGGNASAFFDECSLEKLLTDEDNSQYHIDLLRLAIEEGGILG